MTKTVYRGVNSAAGSSFDDALNGMAKARGGKTGHTNPTLHNEGATANSQYTFWTTNPEVAKNYALRGSGEGVVLTKSVFKPLIKSSPSTKSIQLIQNKSIIINESEVLLKGIIKNDNVEKIKYP